jgi:hypothetical protein
MMIELPQELELALKTQANARGMSVEGYVLEVVERDLAPSLTVNAPATPFKTGRGALSSYGPAPSAQRL